MAYGLGAAPKNIPYGHDVGKDSVDALLAFAKSSGIPVNPTAIAPDRSPPHADDGGYHSTHNAIDFAGSITAMDQFAAWAMKFAPYILELIHTSNAAPGGGYFVHDGQVVGSSVYSSVLSGHYDHVHLAMTPSGVSAAGGGGGVVAGLLSPFTDPMEVLKGLGQIISEGANFFKLATNPFTYARIAYAAGGVACIALGLFLIFGGRGTSQVAEMLGISSRRSATRKAKTSVKARKVPSSTTSAKKTTPAKKSTPVKPSFDHPNVDRKLGQETPPPKVSAAPKSDFTHPSTDTKLGESKPPQVMKSRMVRVTDSGDKLPVKGYPPQYQEALK